MSACEGTSDSSGCEVIDYLPTEDSRQLLWKVQAMDLPERGTVTYSYPETGSLLTGEALAADDISGSTTWIYDDKLEVIGETVVVAEQTVPVGFGHDDDGLLTQAGALEITRHPGHGLVTETELPGTYAVTSERGFNAYGELASEIVNVTGLQEPLVYQVVYDNLTDKPRDALGRVEYKTETIRNSSDQNEQHTVRYLYDTRGRLNVACEQGAWKRKYEYDANSNRTEAHTCTPTNCDAACDDLTTVAGVYDDQDRIESYGSYEFTHNLRGQIILREGPAGDRAFTYDVLGNLTKVVKAGNPTVTIDYVVDGLNRRIAKKVDGDVVRRWLWAGPLRIMAEVDENGYVLKRFVYGTKVNVPEYMHTYDPVTHEQSGTYRIITDQLGSLRLVVNLADGSIAQRMRHDEWGNVLEDTSPGFVPFGFAGGLYDPDTELVRFGARDYDPETGRWMAKDVIGFNGGIVNLYCYASDDPTNRSDHDGRYDDGGEWAFWYMMLGPGSDEEKQETIDRMNFFGGLGAGVGLVCMSAAATLGLEVVIATQGHSAFKIIFHALRVGFRYDRPDEIHRFWHYHFWDW